MDVMANAIVYTKNRVYPKTYIITGATSIVALLLLIFLILFHPAYSVSFSTGLSPAGKILVHEGMEAGVVAWF
jgi:hypothetical protein